MHRNSTVAPASGFTLVELIITIAIAAILLAIALPSFKSSIRSNRMATATNLLISSISLARSEAIRSASGAQICASANGTGCGGTWDDGWIVWGDADADGVLDADEAVVRHVQLTPTLSLTEAGGAGSIVFNSRGTVTGGAGAEFALAPDDCPAASEFVNALTINVSGQVKTEEAPCP